MIPRLKYGNAQIKLYGREYFCVISKHLNDSVYRINYSVLQIELFYLHQSTIRNTCMRVFTNRMFVFYFIQLEI